MRLWTRTLVGFPDVRGPWMDHQLEESIKSIGEKVIMYHDELLGRQVWDTYSILLASPHVAPKLKGLILEQTRLSYTGFKSTLSVLFPVVKELVQTAKDRPDTIHPANQFLISTEERKMKLTQTEISWLQGNTKTDPNLRQRMKYLQRTRDHLVFSQDVFCSWCMQKCARPQVCSRYARLLLLIYTAIHFICLAARALVIAMLPASAMHGEHITNRFARTTWIDTAVECRVLIRYSINYT
jgi:hypothetical protein